LFTEFCCKAAATTIRAQTAAHRADRRRDPGRLGRAALAGADDVSVEETMTLGRSTVRPSLELGQAVDRMRRQNLTTLPVTRSDGVLVGVLRRDDAEQALGRLS